MKNSLQFKALQIFVVSTICGVTIFSLQPPAIQAKKISKSKLTPRIVNGTEAAQNEFPFLARLRTPVTNTTSLLCGCTIIGNRWVITAAHCVFQDTPIEVFTGLYDTAVPNEFQQFFDVERKFIHPEFDESIDLPLPQWFDIALLLLTDPISFDESAQPIPLEPLDYDKSDTATAIGWGLTEFGGESPRIPRKVDLPIVDQVTAVRRVPQVFDHQICAGAPGIDVCSGDSGGPLICFPENPDPENEDEKVLCGIVSAGDCGRSRFGIFTRITWFLEYIENVIAEAGVGLMD